MADGLLSFLLLVLSSCCYVLVGGQTCSAVQFSSFTVTVSAESVNGPIPTARVAWNTTAPPQCVTSVRVDFRTSRSGTAVATNTTTNTSQTEIIQSLRCATNYYIRVVVTGVTSGGVPTMLYSRQVQVLVGDIPQPFQLGTEVTADNTSIRVSWQWSRQGLPMCVDNATVHYQPQGGSPMMYTVNNATVTSATLPNLQCNTNYTIFVLARSGQMNKMSVSKVFFLPARAPPTPTNITTQFMNTSNVKVTWQWTSSGPAPSCFNTTTVTYHPEGGSESSLQLRDPAATETILTVHQCNTRYTISVVSTAGKYRRERMVFLSLQDIPHLFGLRPEVTADNTSIRVSWQWSRDGLPICVDMVTVHYQPEGSSPMMYTAGSTATSATLPNLHCNTKYTIWVYVVGGQIGKTSASRMSFLPARAPPTPTEVTAQFASTSSVRVAWQWTSSGPAPNCFNTTNVTYRPEGGSESFLQLRDPAATEATLVDLHCNTSYTITVVATAGVHRREGVALFTPPGPRNFSAAVLSSTSVRLTWVAPCPTQQYHIYYKGTCDGYVDEGGMVTKHQEQIVDELQEGINYTFTVNQTFSGREVLSTGQVHTRTFTSVPSGAPQSLEGMFVQPTEVFLRWGEVPCIQQNGPITGYVVRYYATCGAERNVQQNKSVVTTGDTIEYLTPNTEYAFQVAAVNVNGTGPFSELVILKGILHIPQLVTVTPVNSTTVTVSWSDVQCFTGIHYLVQYRSTCGGAVRNVTTNGLVQAVNISSLTPNNEYTFQVAAADVNGTGPFSEPITLGGTGAPQLVTVTPVNSTTVTLSWSEVQCFNGSGAVTHYLVQYQFMCGGAVQNVTTYGPVQTVNISGLTPNSGYAFQVAAASVNKTGPFSETITLGGAPQLVTVTPDNSTTVTVSWSEVQCFNGSGAVTHYLVQYQSMCDGAVQNVTTGGPVQNVSGLTPNVALYTFRVAAVGASQKIGPFSNPANVSLHGTTPMCPTDETGSSTGPTSGPSSVLVLVAAIAVSAVVLVVAAICILILVIWWRHKQRSRKVTAVELTDVADTDSVDSKEEQDTSVDNTCYMKLAISPPTIVDYQREVQCSEGEQVTLTVKVAGSPTPTVTWLFNGRKVKDEYSTEVGKDGSLTLITVEPKHAGTYTFTVSNNVGSVEGCTKLVVRAEDEEGASVPRVESNPVTRKKFGEYVSSCHVQNNGGFVVQFQTLPSGEEGHQTTVGKSSENRLLNRFRNITAYDDHRVVLKSISGGVDCEHDYINAAYIDGYSQGKKYIATQGPLPETVTDFWWMVWQEQIHVVAMVTNTVEGGQKKCEHYWPEQGTQEYGPFKVTLTDQQVFADYTIRQLFVSCDKAGGDQLKVTQFHFTSWPDHGVPEYAGPILNYLRRIKKLFRGPTLVHCSAGVGRTGTLMAIDMALEQAAKENVVDIPAIVTKMRRQRMKMVQNSYDLSPTQDQYVFIHDAVLESLTCGDTQIPASGLAGAIGKLKQKDSETGRTGLETQFHVLGQVTPKPTEVIRATASRFPNLNRSIDFLPPDKWRVTLKGETNDYIHASFANGYKQWKRFIITQAPMNSTCRDFWKMVYERECGVIVMLSDLVENGEEVCHQYWPDGSTKGVQKYGEYSVSVLQTTEQDGFIERVISITNPKSGEDHKVTQFQMSCWTPEGLCTSPPAIMAVIEHVLVVQRRTGNRPIVVHGSDTVSRCGVFCSFISATECCKTEGIVDVFQVVKALRIQKPGSVLTVEQYRFIFDLMLLFLESFSIYSNFK